MRRYFHSLSMSLGQKVEIQGDLFHHIFEVCRIQPFQHFELINDLGEAHLVEVQVLGKKSATVLVKEKRKIPAPRKPLIDIYLSFPKVSTFELIVEKSVELGVHQIIPILSDYSHIRTISAFPEAKRERWQRIILQATQQCGRGELMKLGLPTPLRKVMESYSSNPKVLPVFSYEGQAELSLKQRLQSMANPSAIERIDLFVGSEGGFSESEVSLFQSLDLPPVTLGDQILRVETACLTLVGCLKYEFDLFEKDR